MMSEISLTARSGTLNGVFPSAVDTYLYVSLPYSVRSWILTPLLVWCPRIWQDIPHPQYRRRIGPERLHRLTFPLRIGRHGSLRAHLSSP